MALHQRIAAELRRQIRSGALEPGAEIPSLSEISKEWKVSDIVARKAVRSLEADGLIRPVPGRRSVVAEHPSLTRHVPDRYWVGGQTTTYREEGDRARVDVEEEHATVVVPASAKVAARLGINTGEDVTQTKYAIWMGGEVVSISCCWEPLELTRGTAIELPEEGDYAHLGIVGRFTQIGQRVTSVEETLDFRPASEGETVRLALPEGMWVIAIDQRLSTEERVVQAAEITFRPDRYEGFTYTVPLNGDEVSDEIVDAFSSSRAAKLEAERRS